MAKHFDTRYKKLFSNHGMVRQLLEHFVFEDFVHELDYSGLERLDKSFVTEQFMNREADLIYKAPFRDSEMYIYLLLEFQSTVDRFMALRMLRYICEFYQYLVENKVKKLPPVFPILLYNGNSKWTAPHTMEELIITRIPGQYIPHFRYYPIIENEIKPETLVSIKGALSAVFLIENSTVEELQKNISTVINLLKTEDHDIILLFRRWLNDLLGENEKSVHKEISGMEDTREMFAESLKKYGKKFERHGIEKGLEKGIEKGKKETALNMLHRGYAREEITAITGLSLEEIDTLQK